MSESISDIVREMRFVSERNRCYCVTTREFLAYANRIEAAYSEAEAELVQTRDELGLAIEHVNQLKKLNELKVKGHYGYEYKIQSQDDIGGWSNVFTDNPYQEFEYAQKMLEYCEKTWVNTKFRLVRRQVGEWEVSDE